MNAEHSVVSWLLLLLLLPCQDDCRLLPVQVLLVLVPVLLPFLLVLVLVVLVVVVVVVVVGAPPSRRSWCS